MRALGKIFYIMEGERTTSSLERIRKRWHVTYKINPLVYPAKVSRGGGTS